MSEILKEIVEFGRQEAAQAASYLVEKRHLTEKTISLYKMGYFSSLDKFIDRFRKRGWPGSRVLTELDKIRFVFSRQKTEDYWCPFVGRVIWPIHDVYGNIIAITGRLIENSDTQPKYLNTVFKKTHHLFNLNNAFPHILKADYAFIVEGYLDAISAWQSGIPNVLACMSTYVSSWQYTLLGRYCHHACLLLDNDEAGAAGAKRDLERNVLPDDFVKIHRLNFLGGHKDLDEYLQHRSVEDFWVAYKANANKR